MTDRKICVFGAAMLMVTLPIAASAAGDFAGPSGWSATAEQSPSTTRKIAQWHIAGDTSTSVTYIDDSTATYADTIAAMQKNFTDNKIRPATDKDLPCRGQTGHVIEFSFGSDKAMTIINRLVVPDGSGVATITYTRAGGNEFDPDVKKAETAYCAGM